MQASSNRIINRIGEATQQYLTNHTKMPPHLRFIPMNEITNAAVSLFILLCDILLCSIFYVVFFMLYSFMLYYIYPAVPDLSNKSAHS